MPIVLSFERVTDLSIIGFGDSTRNTSLQRRLCGIELLPSKLATLTTSESWTSYNVPMSTVSI